jgi:hypothetical protein
MRWGSSLREFRRIGLTGVTRFEALSSIGPHQSFNKSVRSILEYFQRSPFECLLFLEDDVDFVKVDHIEQALKELPKDWDLLYFGANILHTEPKPTRYSTHLCRIFSGWTTHALAFNKKCITFILENVPGESDEMFDNWLSRQLPTLNSYLVTPMAAYQRPGHSLIWNSATNYESVFTGSDIILNHICKRT